MRAREQGSIGSLLCLWLVLAALAGCQDQGGAVSVRWRIVDLETGTIYDPRNYGAPDGRCYCEEDPAATTRGSGCRASNGWTVHAVRLVVTDPATMEPLLADDPRLVFPCRTREATTPFILPSGAWNLSLRAFDPALPEAGDEAVTPAPSLRNLNRAEIVNLEVVELGVNPLPVFAGP